MGERVLIVETTGGTNPQVKGTRYIAERQAARPTGKDGHGYWNPKVFSDPTPIPEEVIEKMRSGLPAVVRRDPRERYRAILNRISENALAAYRRSGQITWPKSLENELKEIAWKNGDPALLELGGVDQLLRQVEALARHAVETGEMQQKEQDRKKVTLDWHGH